MLWTDETPGQHVTGQYVALVVKNAVRPGRPGRCRDDTRDTPETLPLEGEGSFFARPASCPGCPGYFRMSPNEGIKVPPRTTRPLGGSCLAHMEGSRRPGHRDKLTFTSSRPCPGPVPALSRLSRLSRVDRVILARNGREGVSS